MIDRVGELDNSVKSLRLACGFVNDLRNTQADAPDVYRYHFENFLLRLTGIVDRAHRLAGTSLLLGQSKLSKINANALVLKSVSTDYLEVHKCLINLTTSAAKHRVSRNEVAHSKAFSTRELGMFSAVKALKLDLGNSVSVADLMDEYFSLGGSELASLADEMVRGVAALLVALAPIYDHVLTGDPKGCPA